MYAILKKEMLTPTICRMEVEAPRLARAAAPGQFLIVLPDEKGERIPLTISDYDALRGTVTIVTQKIGASSADIIAKEPGEGFRDVVGPLGLPSDFVNIPLEDALDLGWEILAECFEPNETGLKTNLIRERWPNKEAVS